MKFYQVSFIDFEDNCTYKLFSNKKDAEKMIKIDGDEYGEVIVKRWRADDENGDDCEVLS